MLWRERERDSEMLFNFLCGCVAVFFFFSSGPVCRRGSSFSLDSIGYNNDDLMSRSIELRTYLLEFSDLGHYCSSQTQNLDLVLSLSISGR